MTYSEDTQEIREQIQNILNEASFSSKAKEKEQRVADNIQKKLEPIDGKAEKTNKNVFSDVRVDTDDSSFFIEVKLDDKNSPFIKYDCSVEDGKLVFDMKSIESAFEQGEYGHSEEDTFQDMFMKSLYASKNIKSIEQQIGQQVSQGTDKLKEMILDNLEQLKAETKLNLRDIHGKNVETRTKISEREKKLKKDGLSEDEIKKDADLKELKYELKRYHSFVSGTKSTLKDADMDEEMKSLEDEIKSSRFPDILNKLNDFFSVLTRQKEMSYYIYRKQLQQYVNTDILENAKKHKQETQNTENDKNKSNVDHDKLHSEGEEEEKAKSEVKVDYGKLQTITEMIMSEESLPQTIASIFDSKREIKKLKLSENELMYLTNPSELEQFIAIYDKMLKIATLYIDILNKCNEYRRKKRENGSSLDRHLSLNNLDGMEYWEKVRYLYESFFKIETKITSQNDEKELYDPQNYKVHGFSLCKGVIGKGENIDGFSFINILHIVENYYNKIHNVKYVQCGDDIYYFNREDDPLKIIGRKSNKNNKIIKFSDAFKEFQYNLFLITDKGSNYSLVLFATFIKTEQNSNTSFDTRNEDGEGDDKPFPTMGILKNDSENQQELKEAINEILNESLENENIEEGLETSKTEANKFELDVTDSLKNFLHAQKSPYNTLEVEHYEEPDLKYWSDIKVTNTKNNKRFWVEAKENKYACLGSSSFVYKDGEWTCSTLEDNDPLVNDLLNAINENSREFVRFCKDYLGTEDITLPKDITEDLVEAWRNSGKVTDTDNTVLFITNKIPLENFGEKIASFYKNSKNEPAYYIQIGDDLYLVDRNTNVLNLRTKNGTELKTLSEVYKLGRIQFRLKRYNRPQKTYYSIYEDVKILADEDNVIEDYNCSFLSQDKWPVIITSGDFKGPLKPQDVITDKTKEMQVDTDEQEIKEQFEDICREEELEENLTIPPNENDEIEKELYKNLEKNYDHADRIVRWYRNAKKSGVEEKDLKKTFIENLDNIKDLFKTYEKYIDSLKKMKMLNKKVEINGKQFDVVKDVDKLRMLSGFQSLVKAMGDEINSGTAIETSEQKYAITDEDRKKIRILGFTENVVCWCTEGYETTNKFIFQLWQNSKTLGRGDVYGDPSEQTPYCTHSKEHWDDYSRYMDRYQQFWYLRRIDNDEIANKIATQMYMKRDGIDHDAKLETIKASKYTVGNLDNTEVVNVFKNMEYSGPFTIIAMNDTGNDFLDRNDEHFYMFENLGPYGQEVKKLNDDVLEKEEFQEFTIGGRKIKLINDEGDLIVVPKQDRQESVSRHGALILDGTSNTVGELENLDGCPQKVTMGFEVSDQSKLTDLVGSPHEVGKTVLIDNNHNLQSLKGCPETVGGDFIVRQNKKLMSLDYLPQHIWGYSIRIFNNGELRHLGEFPQDFMDNFVVSGNKLVDLNGCPQKLQKFEIDNEQEIESLVGGPSKVIYFNVRNCSKLKSLNGAPKYAQFIDIVTTDLTQEQIENYRKFNGAMYSIDFFSRNRNEIENADKIVKANRMYYEDHLTEDGKHYKEDGISMKEARKACGLVEKEANSAITTIDNTNIKNVNEEDETEIKEQYENICKEDSVDDVVSDMKKNKSTNGQNPDTKTIKNVSGSEILTLVSSLDGRLILVNPEGETVRRDDGQQLYFDDKMDAVKWAEERNYRIDSSLEDEGLQESESNDIKDFKLLTNVPEDNIRNILDTTKIENKRFEKIQFEKYYGQDYTWACLMNSEECLAMACLKEDEPFKTYVYIAEIQTLKKGYGRYLIEELINKYGKVWLMANTKAGESLINYYRNLNLQEITVENSVYGCTVYFFCTRDCEYEKLENYLIAFYSNEEEMDESEEEIGGDKSDLANVVQGDKIWIDDLREAPEGFKWFKTVRQFIKYVDEHGTSSIALIDTDHDAGDYQKFGGDYIRCIAYLDCIGAKNITIHIHSANPVGANNIRRIISRNKEENGWREVRNVQNRTEQ